MLTFDEAAHRYFWNGSPVVNVTRVLGPLTDYSHVNPEALENARLEGVAMHKMVELDVLGQLDEFNLPAWLVPRLKAWRLFCKEARFVPEHSEERVYHPGLVYAGTLDLRGRFNGTERGIVDLKRSFYAGAVIGLQLAGYAGAVDHGKPKAEHHHRRGALRLLATGKYQYQPFEDKNDFNVFTAALVMCKWKEKYQ